MDWALHFPRVFSLTKQPKLSFRETILPVRDVHSRAFASQKQRARTSDGNGRDRPLQRKTTSPVERAKKGEILCEGREANPSKSNQEEIISLFKRIQSAISKGESPTKEDAGSSPDEPVTEALLDVIRQSRRKTDGERGGGRKEEEEGSVVRRGRPPSKFMKRSPIPSPSGPRAKLIVPNSGKELKETAPKIESMKLVELKELAKTRGIKGYSKLKKCELVDLLLTSSD